MTTAVVRTVRCAAPRITEVTAEVGSGTPAAPATTHCWARRFLAPVRPLGLPAVTVDAAIPPATDPEGVASAAAAALAERTGAEGHDRLSPRIKTLF